MKVRTNILISFATTIISLALVAVGLNYYFVKSAQKLGTVATTDVQSTDLLTAWPTLYNANLALLNNGKVDVASTTWPQLTTATGLTTVGTIGTGVWQGTAVGVAYGGTGTSSPTQYMTILGDGALGLTHASGTGTTGQFLTSNGAGAYPSWQTSTINQTDTYYWSGGHNFGSYINATGTSMFTTLQASSTIQIGDITYVWPSTQTASSSVLSTDNAGNLYWTIDDAVTELFVPCSKSTGAIDSVETGFPTITAANSANTTCYASFYMPTEGTISSIDYVLFSGNTTGNINMDVTMADIIDGTLTSDSVDNDSVTDKQPGSDPIISTLSSTAYDGLTRGRAWAVSMTRNATDVADTAETTINLSGIIVNLTDD